MTLIHEAHDRGLPQLIHLEHELDQAGLHLNHYDVVLVDVDGLVADNHLNFLLALPFHVLSLYEHEIECGVADIELIVPFYYKLGRVFGLGLGDIDLKKEVAKLLLVLVSKDVELLVVYLTCFDVADVVDLVEVCFFSCLNVDPEDVSVGCDDSNLLGLVESDVVRLHVQLIMEDFYLFADFVDIVEYYHTFKGEEDDFPLLFGLDEVEALGNLAVFRTEIYHLVHLNFG